MALSKLPQTGVSDGSFTSIIGFLLLSLSSLFGLSYSKRKR
ncbi:LPXTG cell wall anchor domain-containing protein [Lactobacillus sp. 3B(2020)]